MDEATVLHACRLLHEALCDDLEMRRLVVHVERDGVSITIHPKHGVQERKVKMSLAKILQRMSVRSTSGGSVTSDYRGGQRSSTRMPWRNV